MCQNNEMGTFLPLSDKGESPLKALENLSISELLALFSTCPFLKIRKHLPSTKIIVSKLTISLSLYKIWSHKIKICSLRKHSKLGYFGYISFKKHSVIEWLSWLLNESSVNNLNTFEIFISLPKEKLFN